MLNDFSALDLFSVDGPRQATVASKKALKGRKKLFTKKLVSKFAKGRGKKRAASKRRKMSGFLPLIGRRLHFRGDRRALQGWAVPLSWPSKDVRDSDVWPGDLPFV